MSNKVAIIVGATGLTGKYLVEKTLQDDFFSKIKILVRTPSTLAHPKLEEHIVNFDEPSSYLNFVKGDVLFSCLGTTLEEAGSQEAQYKVDYTYQFQVAEAARKNNVPALVLLSSPYADANSRFYYQRMKGELEYAVQELNFEQLVILQPNQLTGERKTKRKGEGFAAKVTNFLGKIIPEFKNYKPIEAEHVADAMIAAYRQNSKGFTTISRNAVYNLAVGSSL